MTDIAPRSFECDGLATGAGTPYVLTLIEPGGRPEAEVGDKPRPREDGSFFGEDRLTGRLIKFELTIDTYTYDEAQSAWRSLATVWDAESVRRSPGSVVPLRIRQFAGPTRIVFGRPNQIDPANEALMEAGRLDVICDFRCVDHRYYSDTEHSNTISLVRPFTGGIKAPLEAPITTTSSTEGSGDLVVDGDVPAWVALRINGPIVNPSVVIPGVWTVTLNVQLFADEYIDIDPRPETRSVRKNGVANASGTFTADSPYLSEMRVPPGAYEVILRGTDATGTSSVTVSHRDAFLVL